MPAARKPAARKPAARKKRDGPCVTALKRDLARLPKDLAESAVAASALVMAKGLDTRASLAAKSAAQRRLQEAMDRLRELAPPAASKDGVDVLNDEFTARRARLIAEGGARTKN
jgi:hypothetical protein